MRIVNRVRALILTAVLAVSAFAAAPQFVVDGSTSFERARIERLEKSLNFTKVAMPEDWEVTIWPGGQFDEFVKVHNIPTEYAFTYLGLNHTYISEDQMIWHDDVFIRWVLAHEAGHMICECKSEDKANAIARVLTEN